MNRKFNVALLRKPRRNNQTLFFSRLFFFFPRPFLFFCWLFSFFLDFFLFLLTFFSVFRNTYFFFKTFFSFSLNCYHLRSQLFMAYQEHAWRKKWCTALNVDIWWKMVIYFAQGVVLKSPPGRKTISWKFLMKKVSLNITFINFTRMTILSSFWRYIIKSERALEPSRESYNRMDYKNDVTRW